MFGRVAGALNLGGWSAGQADAFRGEIRDAVVTLDAGRTTQELTVTLKEDIEATDPVTGKAITVPRAMPLTFSGDIRLDNLSQRLAVSLPAELVGRFIRVSEGDMVRFFPKGVPIALRGTTTNPEVDLGNIVQQLVEAQVRSRLLPGRDNGGEQRQGDRVRDAIGDLLGGNRDRREGRPR
jgi:hypothetical protein